MGATYNPVPLATIATLLKGAGFEQGSVHTKDGHEVTFERANHNDPQLRVIVYTSCSPNGHGVRGKGKDAIRVCLIADSKRGRVGVASAKRVNRCGTTKSILDRILARAREMYGMANGLAKSTPCQCGAPRYLDSGKCILRWKCPHHQPKSAA